MTDEEIIESIITNGKKKHFEMLYDRYYQKVYRKAYLMVKDADAAQDMAHDVMIKAFVKLSTFEGKSSFSTWLFQITYAHCIDYLRNQKKMIEETIDDEKFDAGEYQEDSNDTIEEKELFESKLENTFDILDEINPQDRVLLMMKYQDNMQIKEIAEFCGCSESALKMKLKRARDKVKEMYHLKYD